MTTFRSFHRTIPVAGIALFALLGFATTVWAQSPTVGADAPEINPGQFAMNEPAVKTLKECRGDVVVVEQWGVKCPPCRALIPHLNELHKKYAADGLRIFAIEAQGHSAAEIKKLMEPLGVAYPVAMGGANAYQCTGIPHAWVISVDGKVVWQGNPSSAEFDKAIEAELVKAKRPQLGKTLNKAVSGLSGKFNKGDLAGARKEAKAIVESEKSSEEAKADAQFVVERVTSLAASKLETAKKLEAEKRYVQALDLYDWVAKALKGDEEGTAAEARAKELRADKEVKREIEAATALEKLLGQVAKVGGKPDYKSALPALKSFAKKYEGTQAADEAQRIIDSNK